MNLDRLVQRLLGRATCRLAARSRLGPKARIRNALGKTDAITVDEDSLILGELLTFAHGGRVSIGKWSFVGEGARLWSGSEITVGDRTLISQGVNILRR